MWDWEDYLDLAYWLADHVDEHIESVQPGVLHKDGYSIGREALFRAAISRAYYAAFHLAKSYVLEVAKVPVDFRSAHKHTVLALGLEGTANEIETEVSANLQSIRKLREWADYQDLRDPERQADKALEHAQAICDRLRHARETNPSSYHERTPSLEWPPRET